jgi:hypothetical protein
MPNQHGPTRTSHTSMTAGEHVDSIENRILAKFQHSSCLAVSVVQKLLKIVVFGAPSPLQIMQTLICTNYKAHIGLFKS